MKFVSPVNDAALAGEIGHILQLQLNDKDKAVLFKSGYENQRPPLIEPNTAAQENIYKYVKSL
ncbi:MAG: hypothetical protein WDO16_13730 [Bacteroidota bacterium]